MGRRFRNRVALVTGGSSGIGLATARLLAAEGAHVWLVARDGTRLQNALEEVRGCRRDGSQNCGAWSADVSDPSQAQGAVAAVTERAGLPDLVINSAGITHPGYFEEIDLSIFRQMMDVNYFGTLYVIKAVIPGMLERGSGHIVNVSSLAGVAGAFGYTAYCASKFAVTGLSDALRAELRHRGIIVSCVFPPDTDTPQLAGENLIKPPETKALGATMTVLSADRVAQSIVKGIAARRYAITPSLESWITYWLSGPGGRGLHFIQDLLLARVRRKMRNGD